jgi:hypothetical protein
MKYLKAPTGIVQAFQGYTLSFLPRYIPGIIWGYWGRSQWLKHSLGINYQVSILGSIVEAAALVITAFIVGVGIVAKANETLLLKVEVIAWVLAFFCWLILGSVIKSILMREEKQSQQFIWASNLGSILRWFSLLIPYIIFWILYGFTVAIIAQTVMLFDKLAITIACAAAAWVVGFIVVIIPSGLGIREITLAYLLHLTIGLPVAQGRWVAVIFRVVNISAELIWLLIGLLIYFLDMHTREKNTPLVVLRSSGICDIIQSDKIAYPHKGGKNGVQKCSQDGFTYIIGNSTGNTNTNASNGSIYN